MKEPTAIECERIEALYLLYYQSKANLNEPVAREFISCSLRTSQYLVNEGWAALIRGENNYDILHITHQGIKAAEHFRAEYDLSVEWVSNENRNNAAVNALRVMPELVDFMPVGSSDPRVVWGATHEQLEWIYIGSETADLIEWLEDITPNQALELLRWDVLPKFSSRKFIVDNPQHSEEEWALVNNGFVSIERNDTDIITLTVEGNVWVWNGERHMPQRGHDLPMISFDLVKVGNRTKIRVSWGFAPDNFVEQIMTVFRAEARRPERSQHGEVVVSERVAAAATHLTQRVQDLQKLIQLHQTLLRQYEERRAVEDDPRRLLEIDLNIAREKEALKDYEAELKMISSFNE